MPQLGSPTLTRPGLIISLGPDLPRAELQVGPSGAEHFQKNNDLSHILNATAWVAIGVDEYGRGLIEHQSASSERTLRSHFWTGPNKQIIMYLSRVNPEDLGFEQVDAEQPGSIEVAHSTGDFEKPALLSITYTDRHEVTGLEFASRVLVYSAVAPVRADFPY